MRNGSFLFRILGAVFALGALHPSASLATDGSASEGPATDESAPEEPTRQAGEARWVPSLAITSGVTVQQQQGSADSFVFEDMNPDPVPLQGFFNGDDVAVSPFVGGALELMAPALAIPTRPRLFVSGEILPTFASKREVVIDGDPGCIRGPKPGAPCARAGGENFSQDSANGEGTKTTAKVDTLVFGASLGAAFPLQLGDRQLRIKPSVAWINYEIDADGLVVNANCDPANNCAGVGGFLRETVLTANDSQRFNGIGPGLDIEMDTVQYGPLGVSLFLGGRAYAILGDRDISFGATKSYDDQLGTDDATALFGVKVDPWMFRAHVGIRFHYLGSED